jgi:hypothetical protein
MSLEDKFRKWFENQKAKKSQGTSSFSEDFLKNYGFDPATPIPLTPWQTFGAKRSPYIGWDKFVSAPQPAAAADPLEDFIRAYAGERPNASSSTAGAYAKAYQDQLRAFAQQKAMTEQRLSDVLAYADSLQASAPSRTAAIVEPYVAELNRLRGQNTQDVADAQQQQRNTIINQQAALQAQGIDPAVLQASNDYYGGRLEQIAQANNQQIDARQGAGMQYNVDVAGVNQAVMDAARTQAAMQRDAIVAQIITQEAEAGSKYAIAEAEARDRDRMAQYEMDRQFRQDELAGLEAWNAMQGPDTDINRTRAGVIEPALQGYRDQYKGETEAAINQMAFMIETGVFDPNTTPVELLQAFPKAERDKVLQAAGHFYRIISQVKPRSSTVSQSDVARILGL